MQAKLIASNELGLGAWKEQMKAMLPLYLGEMERQRSPSPVSVGWLNKQEATLLLFGHPTLTGDGDRESSLSISPT